MFSFPVGHEESDLLNHLLTTVDAQDAVYIGTGGSPASVLRLRRKGGDSVVLKFLLGHKGMVDGHDLASFRLKIAQMRTIQRDLPKLRPFYPELLCEFSGEHWAAYCLPFYEGREVTTFLQQADPDTEQFFTRLRYIINTLIAYGYATSALPAPKDHVAQTHLHRIRRRLWLLDAQLPQEVLYTTQVSVNGYACRPVPALLELLQRNRNLLTMLQPARLYFPVHGDANLGNFLLDCRAATNGQATYAFKVLDIRGTLEYWDVLYDFAKMLFSLSSFDSGMKSGFAIRREETRDGTLCYEVKLREHHALAYREAAMAFPDFLDSVDAYKQYLQKDDPHWRQRLLFIHALHIIAESACRLSDRKERTLKGKQDDVPVHEELALGFYLVGTLLLNKLMHEYEAGRPLSFALDIYA